MLDVFVIAGDTMEEILRGYRDLTGYPSMPPLWSFRHLDEPRLIFSADEVNEICDRMRAEHYPVMSSIWIPAVPRPTGCANGNSTKNAFPIPKWFIQGLKKKDIASLWHLYVAENAEQIDEARKNDYIAADKETRSEGSNFSALTMRNH